jgi:Putative MetA-pathway of phenol degradation
MLKLASFSVLSLGFAAAAFADHGKGAVGGKTISPRTLSEESFSLDVGFRYQKSETFSDDRLLTADANGHDLHGVDWAAEYSLGLAYGVTNHLSVSFALPFEVLHGFKFVDGGVVDEANSVVGVGDAVAMGKYSLLADPVELAVLAGVKIPTGSTSQLANSGTPLEPEHQPGTGSWDPILGAAVGRQYEQVTIGASVLYRITSKGRHDYQPGQQVQAAFKAEHQFLGLGTFPRLYGSLELSELFSAKNKTAGVKNQDSGGSIVGLGLGVRLRADAHMTIAATFTIPVYQGLYGEQHKERYELLFGTAYDF